MTVDLYFDMIGRKTAALISASIEAGALLATDDEAVITRYRQFGWALGLAFQLNDDVLGIWGQEQATGKEPSDLARHKKTLPVIYAFEHAGPEDRERLAALYAHARARRRPGSPRRWRSSSGPAPRTTPARRRDASATRRSPSSTPPASCSPRPASSSSRSSSA